MLSEHRIQEVIQRYEDWWARRNDRPVCYMIYPRRPQFDPARVKPWMARPLVEKWTTYIHEFLLGQALELALRDGDWRYVDEAIDFFKHYAELTESAAEGYHFLNPNFGPGSLSAYLTGFSEFKETTIWLELPQPMEWDALLAINDQTRAPYADAALEAVRRLVARVQKDFVIGEPDHGGVVDVLASLRGTQNLLMDLLVEPENVTRVLLALERIWFRYFDEFHSIIAPGNHGAHAVVMRYLSAKPMTLGICDFSAMISPDQFREFCAPFLQRQFERFEGRAVYHMDGPGQIPHLDQLCAMDSLFAIQWVQGAGNPGPLSERWDPLYRKMLDAGKRVCLGGLPKDTDAVRRFFEKYPAREFQFSARPNNPEEAEAIVRFIETLPR